MQLAYLSQHIYEGLRNSCFLGLISTAWVSKARFVREGGRQQDCCSAHLESQLSLPHEMYRLSKWTAVRRWAAPTAARIMSPRVYWVKELTTAIALTAI